jgi:hypothetical protein
VPNFSQKIDKMKNSLICAKVAQVLWYITKRLRSAQNVLKKNPFFFSSSWIFGDQT